MKRVPKTVIAQAIADQTIFGYKNRVRVYRALMKCKYNRVVEMYRLMFYAESTHGMTLCEMASVIGSLLCNIFSTSDIVAGAQFVYRSNGDNECQFKGQIIKLPC